MVHVYRVHNLVALVGKLTSSAKLAILAILLLIQMLRKRSVNRAQLHTAKFALETTVLRAVMAISRRLIRMVPLNVSVLKVLVEA